MRIRPSEITPKALYLRRREFLALGAAGAGTLLLPGRADAAPAEVPRGRKLEGVKPGQPSTDEKKNSFDEITHYNNFYEFGTDKDDPARGALEVWVQVREVDREDPFAGDAADHDVVAVRGRHGVRLLREREP